MLLSSGKSITRSCGSGKPLHVLMTFVSILFCTLTVFTCASAQIAPKATDKRNEPKATPRYRERPRIRTTVPSASRTPASIESDNFLTLGDRFREKEKWNAAEAAYKESAKVWPGNAEALLELGFIYVDRNKLSDAQSVYSKLRALNSSYATELLTEINRRKASR
jgi:tetratricopeptide (TPR) repeat protein